MDTDDWRDLMRLYLVRRTRGFIMQHYVVLALREENRLCVIEEQQDSQREPKLICTLGLA